VFLSIECGNVRCLFLLNNFTVFDNWFVMLSRTVDIQHSRPIFPDWNCYCFFGILKIIGFTKLLSYTDGSVARSQRAAHINYASDTGHCRRCYSYAETIIAHRPLANYSLLTYDKG
jgi:hypothetical protein